MGGLFKRNRERNENDEFGYEKTLSAASMKLNKNGNGASKQSLRNYKVLRVGDVAFEGHTSNSFSFGRFVMNDNEDGIMSPRFASLKPKHKLQVNYWKYYVHYEPIMKYVLVKATKAGTMMNELVYDDLFKEVINVPSITEQKKIGQFLSSLATLLSLQQKKLEQLKLLKKAMLQQLFVSDKNTLVPNIRFNGFNSSWEQRKLGEVSKRVKGNDGRMNLPLLTISAKNGWMTQKKRFSSNIAGREKKNYTLLKQNQLSYNHGNSKAAVFGTVFELSNYQEALVPKVYHSFVLDSRYSSKFVEAYFHTKKLDRQLRQFISSTARMDGLLNISYDDFMKLKLYLPNTAEQIKISKLLIKLEGLLSLQQSKINQLLALKKYMLQKLFI